MKTERTTADKFRLGMATALTGAAIATGAPALAETGAPPMAPQVAHAAAGPNHDPSLARYAKSQTEVEVQRMTKGALDSFTGQIASILALNPAGDIDRMLGLSPALDGSGALNDLQQQQLKDAAENFVKSLPVGVLPVNLQQLAREAVRKSSQPDRHIETVRIGDLGAVGSDIAKRMLKELRTVQPAAFYALASAAAAGAGALAYSRGSDGLEKVGIKPEFSVALNKHISLQAELHFGKHFRDPTGAIGMTATTTVRDAQISGKVMVNVNGPDRGRTTAEVNVAHTSSGLSATAILNGNGKFDARLSSRTPLSGDLSGLILDQSLQWQQGIDTRWTANLSGVTSSGWTVGAGASYGFKHGDIAASLSATRTMTLSNKDDFSYGIRAATDGKNHSIGFGAQLKF